MSWILKERLSDGAVLLERRVRWGEVNNHEQRIVSPDELESWFFCDSCEEYFEPGETDVITMDNGDEICYDCYCDYGCTCESCGAHIYTDDALWSESEEGYWCQSCGDDELCWCAGHETYESTSRNSFYDVGGEYYCEDYCNDHFHWCYGCEEYHYEDTDMYEIDGEYYCSDYCSESGDFRWCEGHQTYESGDDFCLVEDDYYCEDYCEEHFIWCSGHEEWETPWSDNFYDVYEDGDLYCEDYCATNYLQCQHCGNYFPLGEEENGIYDDDDDWICHDCHAGNEPALRMRQAETYRSPQSTTAPRLSGGYISSYHAHSRAQKAVMLDDVPRTNEPHIGFELEVHKDSGRVLDEDSQAIHDIIGDYALFERDSSIEPGFEIITRPGTLNTHLDRFEKTEAMCLELRRRGYSSHNSGVCGLHVHIDRAYFRHINQDLVNAKFLYIFEKYWENLVKFSRRERFGYCAKTPKEYKRFDEYLRTEVAEKLTIANLVKYRRGVCGHFSAVNISRDDTIEIRLWRGSILPLTLKATIKLTSRLAEIVKNKTVSEIANLSWADILGNDEDILAYWESVKNRALPAAALVS